jgi:uncharacterized membrane protein (DUF485 family)
MQKQKLALIVVSIALAMSIVYIAVDAYQAMMLQEQFNAYQQGVQVGYEQAVLALVQQVSTCQQVPVTYGNQTINVIAVACLQQSQS